MFKKILLGIAAILVIIVGIAAVKSPHYEVKRDILIQASENKVFPYLNNAKLMDSWNPWSEEDPQVKMSFSGSAETSEGRMGTGSATVIESIPNQSVKTKIEYLKPFQMVQESQMTIQPSGTGSTVTWRVYGENNLIGQNQ